jgi:hypothetical protein
MSSQYCTPYRMIPYNQVGQHLVMPSACVLTCELFKQSPATIMRLPMCVGCTPSHFRLGIHASGPIRSQCLSLRCAVLGLQVARVDFMGLCLPGGEVVAAHARPADGGVYYDVAIINPQGGEWYAQLRMLFKCTGQDGRVHQLAFVRCYQDLGPAPPPYQDCTLLRLEEEAAPKDCPADAEGRRYIQPQQKRRKAHGQQAVPTGWVVPCYEVFDIHHISRIVLVQPFEAAAGTWVLNPWIRCSPPSKG